MSTGQKLIIISPCFNEEQSLDTFARALTDEVGFLKTTHSQLDCSVVLIDDGSSDGTWKKIQALGQTNALPILGLKFSRNFGHQSAICAGLDFAYENFNLTDDDTVIIMDSDGQHPPRFLRELIAGRREGFHHVQMIRENNIGGISKKFISPLFYKVFRALSGIYLPEGSADFRAFSGHFLKQYLKFHETMRFNRGLFQWLGFRTKYIPYEAADRLAGKSSYSFRKMSQLAFGGLTYFSSKPLIFTIGATTFIGFLFCLVYGIYEIVTIFVLGGKYVPGWPTIIFVVTLWGSLLSFSQLWMGLYIARIFDEIKRRPIYIVESFSRKS